ncbi:transmembrane protein 207 [Rana temporaria]|uniref:transmembrane protein 207 n=1 Tax=Rana temporaria TaxID=8407 RepID=UPI001AAD7DF7|nr:transmembrane protein 207 [Rana temporaria]
MKSKTACSYFLNLFTGAVYFAFPQPSCSSVCDISDICVNYIEQPIHLWYIWVFLVVLLIVLIRCLVDCCLQCRTKRRKLSRKMVTVVTLSGLDSLQGKEILQHSNYQTWTSHETLETTFCAVNFGGLESGAPPSYEELFSTNKAQLEL